MTQPKRTWRNSLFFLTVVSLTLALLPIGLYGLFQSRTQAQQLQTLLEERLAFKSLAWSVHENELISNALIAGRALGEVMPGLSEDAERCSETLAHFVQANPQFSAAIWIPPDGMISCSPANRPIDLSDSENVRRMQEDPRERVVRVNDPVVSTSAVLSALQPVFTGSGTYIGFMAVSVTLDRLEPSEVERFNFQPIRRALLSSDGLQLVESDRGDGKSWQPEGGRDLAAVAGEPFEIVPYIDEAGEDRILTSAAIGDGAAVSLAVWDPVEAAEAMNINTTSSALLPIVSWLASVGVVLFVVHNFILRDLTELGRRVRGFRAPESELNTQAQVLHSREMTELAEVFDRMSETVREDRAGMEHALEEKSMLIQETHHRVKNNLQMILSILNLQVREVESDEARSSLQRVQMRVLGLSRVHSHIYQGDPVAVVDTAPLIEHVALEVMRSSGVGAEALAFKRNLAPIILKTEQALPLGLLVSEITTLALLEASQSTSGTVTWTLMTELASDKNVTLSSVISVAPDHGRMTMLDQLGQHMMTALATKLGGKLTLYSHDGQHNIMLKFQRN